MNKKRILIVDDDQDILRMLEFGLKKLGPEYEIQTAKDIQTAISNMERKRFDLILTDYMMPNMTGVDLARAARKMSPDTQVVLMTAYGTNKLRHTTDYLGFDGYLNKPFSIDQVRKVVQDLGKDPVVEKNPPAAPPQPAASLPDDPAPAQAEVPDLAGNLSIEELLEKLHVDAGTRGVLLINAQGNPLQSAGQIEQAKVEYISALVAANYYSAEELSNLVDNQKIFGASFFEGDTFNLYVCTVNEKYLLATIFNSRLRPGAVWFYARQTASALIPLLD